MAGLCPYVLERYYMRCPVGGEDKCGPSRFCKQSIGNLILDNNYLANLMKPLVLNYLSLRMEIIFLLSLTRHLPKSIWIDD